ncbi:MAG: hypothetical protein LBM77_10705 [Spirochaetaceae bacterium]|nr:hypothetical protein [Spirochaetaceae bacterium]
MYLRYNNHVLTTMINDISTKIETITKAYLAMNTEGRALLTELSKRLLNISLIVSTAPKRSKK